jgi:hypothetical protein
MKIEAQSWARAAIGTGNTPSLSILMHEQQTTYAFTFHQTQNAGFLSIIGMRSSLHTAAKLYEESFIAYTSAAHQKFRYYLLVPYFA